jgi:hypothetical protein
LRQLELCGLDPFDPSAVLRARGGGVITRVHDAVQRELALVFREFRLSGVCTEPRGVLAEASGHSLRPDFLVPAPDGGFQWVVDVVTADAWGAGAVSLGQALRRAEGAKHAKYRRVLARTLVMRLAAFGVSTLGGLGPGAHAFLAWLACRLRARLSSLDARATRLPARLQAYFTQRVSVALHRAQGHVLRYRAAQWGTQAAAELLWADCAGAAAPAGARAWDPVGSSELRHVDVGFEDGWDPLEGAAGGG